MPKTLRTQVKIFVKKIMLRRKGVIIYNGTVFSGVRFLGKATIEPYCRISGDPAIVIGDNFYMNASCHILGNITFGSDVMIGPKTIMWGRDHLMVAGQPMCKQDHIKEDIVVGDDVWIGANVTILKGVTIGTGAVVAAGALVVKDIPEYSIVGGNPAKVIKKRSR